MGWAESMTAFCAASETARDTIQILSKQGILPEHLLEHIMITKDAENLATKV
jgi:hypothetical protein